MSTLLDAALRYAARGWPVFPVAPRGKIPAVRGGRGCLDATTDPDRVARWWAAHPDHNIGVATGVAFDALDVDSAAGLAALDDLCADQGAVLGPTAVTGGGGWHCYVTPTGLGNRAGFIEGCDWRGRGGYVVVPPSVHPSGDPYRWLDGFGPDRPPEPTPEWLAEALRRPDIVLPAAPGGAPPVRTGQGGAYGRRALEAEAGRVALAEVGQRNDALNRAAHSLGQLVAGGQLDAGVVIDTLLSAAARAGLGGVEAQRTITSGMRSGLQRPRVAS